MKRFNKKVLVISIFILIIVAYLIYAGIRDTMVYYITASELKTKDTSLNSDGLRLGGRVIDGSISWDPKTTELKFVLTDSKDQVQVIYRGIVPDTFKGGADIIVEGSYVPPGVFQANKLIAKCPSKFESNK